MNRKLLKVLDDIDRAEAKIAEWQEHLARLHEQRVQLEEKEIVRAVRAMGMTSRELVAAVDGIYAGKLTLAEISVTGDTGAAVDGIAGIAAGAASGAADAESTVLGSSAEMPPGMETGVFADAGSSTETEGCGPEKGSCRAG